MVAQAGHTGKKVGQKDEALVGRLVRGAVGGVLAGVVFAVVTMWFAAATGGQATMPLHMISTIPLGAAAMQAGTTSAGVGLAMHLVLSVLFGVVFALVVPALRTNGTVALVGTVYGAGLYVVNFWIFGQTVFPVFAMANQPFELFAHVVFGTLLSFAFFGSGVRRGERVLAVGRESHGQAAG